MKYLFLNDLDHTLKIWEFIMLQNELRIKMEKKSGKRFFEDRLDFLPQVGSELNEHGAIMKPIKGYRQLRRLINDDETFDYLNYLPRVPSKYGSSIDQLDFVRGLNAFPIALFPMILDNWLDNRRVFVLDKPKLIPFLNPLKENYLDKMPYESFFLNLNQTFFFDQEEDAIPFSSILISSDQDFIDFLVIPHAIEELVPDSKTFEKYNKYITSGKKFKERDYLNLNIFGGDPGFTGFSVNKDSLHIHAYEGSDRLEMPLLNEGEKLSLIKNDNGSQILEDYDIIQLINGFIRLVSNLKKKTDYKKIFSEIDASEDFNEKDSFNWIKIPVTQTYRISEDETGVTLLQREDLGISRVGTEKSPHVRRGHWRTITLKDGESKKIWINQCTIREDKLETEHLVGGGTFIT